MPEAEYARLIRGLKVPRYFLSLRYKDGPQSLAVDEEGGDLLDAIAPRDHVLDTARDLINGTRISGINWRTCAFEVTDDTGQVVLTVPFSEAVE
jgi:hypothetical protein